MALHAVGKNFLELLFFSAMRLRREEIEKRLCLSDFVVSLKLFVLNTSAKTLDNPFLILHKKTEDNGSCSLQLIKHLN